MIKKNLIIISAYFPYTKYEVFMETEIAELSKYFDKIYLLPGKVDSYKRQVPANVHIIDLLYKDNKQKAGIKDLLYALKIAFFELFGKFTLKKIRHFKKDVFFFISKIKESKALEEFIVNNKLQNAIYYSVWAYNYATALAILKQKGIINKLYFRAHGFDVYHFRRPIRGYAQFLEYNLKAVNQIIAASNATCNYLNTYYSKWINKYLTINLSVYDRGINPRPILTNQLTILSVSNLHPVKRIPLIIETLNHIRNGIKWIHIGAPTSQITELSNNINTTIETQFIDRISQKELVEFYNHTPINLFIHFSESEGGVPLAIQEAISFGIPVLATNVGGIPEIVNEKNGILLPKDFEVKAAAKIIDEFANSPLNTKQARLAIKEDWKNRFNAETNFAKFAALLLGEN